MAIWAVSASPLIMGNDMRNVSAASKAILFNAEAIAVSQDPLGKMGIRLSADVAQQLWVRELSPSASGRSRAAVALYHKGGSVLPQPPVDITLNFSDVPRCPTGAGIPRPERHMTLVQPETDSSPRLLSAPNLVARPLPSPRCSRRRTRHLVGCDAHTATRPLRGK